MKENVIIKKLSLQDIDLIVEWRMRVIDEVFHGSDPNIYKELITANRNYYLKHLSDDTHIACLTLLKDNIIGCGSVCFHDELPSPDNFTGKCACLMNIFTLSEYRGLGAAGKMINWLIKTSIKKGAQKIYLESTEIAKDIYSKHGFKPIYNYMKYYNC